jgi:adenylate kinase
MELQSYMKNGSLVPDEVADKMAFQAIKSLGSANAFILDGYPRTMNQAAALETVASSMSLKTNTSKPNTIYYWYAIHIKLEKWVAVEKMLARVTCKNCGGNFNVADILTDGYHMPAILPDRSKCRIGYLKCNPELVKRFVHMLFR